MSHGQKNLDLAVGLARLKADASNLQSDVSQRASYKNEQTRDVSLILIVIFAVIFLILNLRMLMTENFAYSILSIPCALIIAFIAVRRASAGRRLKQIQENQLEEFRKRKEN